jgi:hypothetical protein
MAIFGLVSFVWAVRSDVPKFFVAQGGYFVFMGLYLGLHPVLPPGEMRTVLVWFLLLGSGVCLVLWLVLLRTVRRERRAAAKGAGGS